MFTLLIILTVLLYGASAFFQYQKLSKKTDRQINSLPVSPSIFQHQQTSKFFGFLAVTLHTFVLHKTLHLDSGINLSLFTTGSLVSWLVALVLIISSLRQKVDNLFIAVFPMAALLILLEAVFPHPEPKPYALGVISHILLSILSYSIFTLAAFQAVLLYKQDLTLKRNLSDSFLNSLPPLQTMERLLFEMLWTGFILLSASLVSGFLFVDDILNQHMAHKSVLSIISWAIFAILLAGRVFWGWRGHKAIYWTIGGFLSLMLGFFGSKLVLEIFLHSPS